MDSYVVGLLSRHHGNAVVWRHSLALRSNRLGAGVRDVTCDPHSLCSNEHAAARPRMARPCSARWRHRFDHPRYNIYNKTSLFFHCMMMYFYIMNDTMAYLLKAGTVEPDKQPLLGNCTRNENNCIGYMDWIHNKLLLTPMVLCS
jgi:hypothetical protein